MSEYQLCWCCANAIGGCEWSDKLMPVEGWTAKLVKPNGSKPYTTYAISECPNFKRDAYEGGTKRIVKDDAE